jgi:hypothetical protein
VLPLHCSDRNGQDKTLGAGESLAQKVTATRCFQQPPTGRACTQWWIVCLAYDEIGGQQLGGELRRRLPDQLVPARTPGPRSWVQRCALKESPGRGKVVERIPPAGQVVEGFPDRGCGGPRDI